MKIDFKEKRIYFQENAEILEENHIKIVLPVARIRL